MADAVVRKCFSVLEPFTFTTPGAESLVFLELAGDKWVCLIVAFLGRFPLFPRFDFLKFNWAALV